MNVNFLKVKKEISRARRRAWLGLRFKRLLILLVLLGGLGLAWHERSRLETWLNPPETPSRPASHSAAGPPQTANQSAPAATGQPIYSWRDKHGVRTFSDRPPAQSDYRPVGQFAGCTELEASTPALEEAGSGRWPRLKRWLKATARSLTSNKNSDRQVEQ